MTSEIQSSYNWAYGAVRTGHKMLPFLLQALESRGALPDASITLRQFATRIDDAASDLTTLAEHLQAPELDEAARYLRNACKDMESCITANHAQNPSEAVRSLRTVIHELGYAKARLDTQKVVRYRFWLLNPWKFYPRRPQSALSKKSPPAIDA